MPPTLQVSIQSTDSGTNRRKAFWVWFGFSLCTVVTFLWFFIPAFIIRPFRYQEPRSLWLAMYLRQRAPLGTLVAGLACAALGIALWRMVRRRYQILIAAVLVVVSFSAAMARLNYFEWMFHPVTDAKFVAEADSKLDAKEMILAVREGDDARAYPISQMAYHHVLNDVVGGRPIVATY